MSDSKSQDLQRDDIDLLALVERSILFFKKYKWVFIVAAVIGLLLGFLKYRSLPDLYKSRLILQSTLLSNQNNIQIAKSWSSLLKNDGHDYLATLFNCSKDVLIKLKEMKPEEIQKIFTPDNPNGFFLDVKVTDSSMLDELQKGIIHGFNNHESVKNRLTERRNRWQVLINKTGAEILRLDSVKKTMENILSGKRPGSSLIIDVPGISRQLIEMNEKHLGYREQLRFANAVEVLQGFNDSKSLIRHNVLVWLFLGLAPCLAIAWLVTLFHSINQKLKDRARLRQES